MSTETKKDETTGITIKTDTGQIHLEGQRHGAFLAVETGTGAVVTRLVRNSVKELRDACNRILGENS